MSQAERKVRLNYFPRRLLKTLSSAKKPKYFVYFVSDGTAVKIGKTTGTVDGRVKELQTGNPRKISVLFAIPVKTESGAYDIENHFHLAFQDYRLSGEWFDIADILTRDLLTDEFGINAFADENVFSGCEVSETAEHEESGRAEESEQTDRPILMTIRQCARTGILPEHRLRMLVKTGEIKPFMAGSRAYVNHNYVVEWVKGKTE